MVINGKPVANTLLIGGSSDTDNVTYLLTGGSSDTEVGAFQSGLKSVGGSNLCRAIFLLYDFRKVRIPQNHDKR